MRQFRDNSGEKEGVKARHWEAKIQQASAKEEKMWVGEVSTEICEKCPRGFTREGDLEGKSEKGKGVVLFMELLMEVLGNGKKKN